MSIDDRTFQSVLFVALFLGAASLVAAEPTTTTADDRAAVERLRKAGVVLTETTGVVTGAFIKDTADMTDDNFAALGSLKNLKTLNISSKKLNDQYARPADGNDGPRGPAQPIRRNSPTRASRRSPSSRT